MSLRVAVLKGGSSLERQVSLRSGAQVQDALERNGHEVQAIDVGSDLVERLRRSEAEVAFIALHGQEGEDGTIQELLEAIDLPYTGSGPSACARCTDKALAKRLIREAGMPTPDFCALTEWAIEKLGAAAALEDIERRLGFPLVVKPASQGSALGIKFAADAQQLPGAIVGALSYDRKALLERYIDGRDLAVSVLEDPRPGAAPQALPVVEAIPRGSDFYSYESRYQIGMTEFVCPAALEPELAERAHELALDCYRLLGCHGFARVDLMLAKDSSQLEVIEVNVVPGLTETSLLPQAADAAEIAFDDLVERILQSAFSRPKALSLRSC